MEVAPATDFDFTFPSYTSLLIAVNANHNSSHATIPFAWEEKPGVPKTPAKLLEEDDFSFPVSCSFDREIECERGRERGFSTSSRVPSSRSRRTRSLSPLGSSDRRQQVAPSSPAPSTDNGSSRRWGFLDLFLFRSASDCRAMDRDPLKKYSANFRKHDQDIRSSGSMSKRRGRISAHELHYNVNRAVSNDLKKKTYLPYKQGRYSRKILVQSVNKQTYP